MNILLNLLRSAYKISGSDSSSATYEMKAHICDVTLFITVTLHMLLNYIFLTRLILLAQYSSIYLFR